jgi:acetyltransferase-like isoleucine patch superfamily enzyme
MPSTTLAAGDHAFANGHVYDRVADLDAARRSMTSRTAVATDHDAELLVAVWRQFDAAASVGEGVKLGLNARMINLGPPGQARLEDLCVVRGCLRVEPQGHLRIGSFVYVGDGVIVSAQQEVEIGEATLIAHGVMVFDNDSHPLNASAREVQFRHMLGVRDRSAPVEVASAPVRIGRRCWIGMNSLVMKGVTIGDNTVVASGSVVTADLPAGMVAAGNPARVVRPLSADELADISQPTVDPR